MYKDQTITIDKNNKNIAILSTNTLIIDDNILSDYDWNTIKTYSINNIKKLAVNCSNLNDKYIYDILTQTTKIESLRIYNSEFDQSDLSNLIKGISENTTLTHICIHGFNNQHLIKILNALSLNTKITNVDLSQNYIDISCVNTIINMINLNDNIISLNLSDNKLKINDIIEICKGINSSIELNFLYNDYNENEDINLYREFIKTYNKPKNLIIL